MKTILLSLSLLFTSLFMQATEAAVHFVTPDYEIKVGSEFYVDVMISKAPKVYGVELELQYDRGHLTLIDSNETKAGIQIIDGDFFKTKKFFTLFNKVDNISGQINYAVSQVKPAKAVSGDGHLVRLLFKSTGKAGIGTIMVTKAELGTVDGKTLSLPLGATLLLSFNTDYQEGEKPPNGLSNYARLCLAVVVMLSILLMIGFGIFKLKKAKQKPQVIGLS